MDRTLTFEKHLMETQRILHLNCFKLGKVKKVIPDQTRIHFYRQAILHAICIILQLWQS